jgi:hypothetical protein
LYGPKWKKGESLKLNTGQSLVSAVDATTVIVVRAPADDVTVTCGGPAMVDAKAGSPAGEADPAQQEGTQLGKRYADETLGIELLCTRPGRGTLAVNGSPLPFKDAKALPASD